MKTCALAVVALLLLPTFTVSAQDRCVGNHQARSTESGVGNGWIADSPNTCVLYISASNEPVMGTRIYRFGSSRPDQSSTSTSGGLQAIVIDGPARIRSGPGLDHSFLRWCAQGLDLTIWPPAVDGWLLASCYGANGWIHESLVRFGATLTQPGSETSAEGPVSFPAGAYPAVIKAGPARIRSGPGLEFASQRWCLEGWPLTVWAPAERGWMRASCYGSNGWIHFSLVEIGTAN